MKIHNGLATSPWICCILFACLVAVLSTPCSRIPTPPVTREQALRKLPRKEWPDFENDLDTASLRNAVRQSLKYLERVPEDTTFRFGPDVYTAYHMKQSHLLLLDLLQHGENAGDLKMIIEEWFEVYQAVGSDGRGSTLFTGYYEPVLDVACVQSDEYPVPLYFRPSDLTNEPVKLPDGRVFTASRKENGRTVPYYSRSQIVQGALSGRNLEIAFARIRIDVFMLQVQGSGLIRFPDGRCVRVGYAGTNGHPYRSIGKVLIDEGRIPKEKMSLFAIREFFRAHPEEMGRILNLNPSYVFFRVLKGGPYGNIGVTLTPGRSIATDSALFPKGALAYIQSRKPFLGPDGTPVEWRDFGRFVLNQDTGGAIRGPGRVDLFWGSGPYAEAAAAYSKHQGLLYFLIMKNIKQPKPN